MMLGVTDIVKDLGVTAMTVRRWINLGQIKASYGGSNREGYKIDEADYQAFLDTHPKYRMVHNRELYNGNEIRAREDALLCVLAKVISSKGVVKEEKRDERYMNGYNRAVTDITAFIEQEMRKKGAEFIESRSEQTT